MFSKPRAQIAPPLGHQEGADLQRPGPERDAVPAALRRATATAIGAAARGPSVACRRGCRGALFQGRGPPRTAAKPLAARAARVTRPCPPCGASPGCVTLAVPGGAAAAGRGRIPGARRVWLRILIPHPDFRPPPAIRASPPAPPPAAATPHPSDPRPTGAPFRGPWTVQILHRTNPETRGKPRQTLYETDAAL